MYAFKQINTLSRHFKLIYKINIYAVPIRTGCHWDDSDKASLDDSDGCDHSDMHDDWDGWDDLDDSDRRDNSDMITRTDGMALIGN
jgi:hypothetical protein